jgi:hypothetical protein
MVYIARLPSLIRRSATQCRSGGLCFPAAAIHEGPGTQRQPSLHAALLLPGRPRGGGFRPQEGAAPVQGPSTVGQAGGSACRPRVRFRHRGAGARPGGESVEGRPDILTRPAVNSRREASAVGPRTRSGGWRVEA